MHFSFSLRVELRGAMLLAILVMLATACGGGGATGQGSDPGLTKVTADAVLRYRWYIAANADDLVNWTTQLRGQIVAGELEKAESRYATSRVQYGQVEPVARMFPALDRRLNGPTGYFHRVERAIFEEERIDGLKPLAKKMQEEVRALHRRLVEAEPKPAQIVAAARAMLGADATSAIEGRAEPYSHVDLVDIAANIEAAQAAFEAARPQLAHADLPLVEAIELGFVDAYAALKPTGNAAREPQTREPAAGARFISYTDLSPEDKRAIRGALQRLAQLFTEAEAAF